LRFITLSSPFYPNLQVLVWWFCPPGFCPGTHPLYRGARAVSTMARYNFGKKRANRAPRLQRNGKIGKETENPAAPHRAGAGVRGRFTQILHNLYRSLLARRGGDTL